MYQTEISLKTELEKDDSINTLEIEKQKDNPTKSSYILKYTRKKNELKELTQETNLPKAKNSLFMLDFIIIKNNEENNESLLQINCHEIAAIHFEDYYERIYSYNDIIKENKYFKAIDNIEEIKDILDYILCENFKNSKKIFIKLENNTLYLHIMLTYFDTIKEIILTMPKKLLKEEEKIFMLPMAMKEIQTKMNYYEKENKKYKKNVFENDNNSMGNINSNNITFYEYYLKLEDKKKKEKIKEKEKEEEIYRSCQQSIISETHDTSYNSILSEEKKNKKKGIIKKKKKIMKKRIKSKEIKENK
jgi:hypothetical protein